MKNIFIVALASSLYLGACNPATNHTQLAHNEESAKHNKAHGATHWSYSG